jgi:plasmid stabilization system protein ParE
MTSRPWGIRRRWWKRSGPEGRDVRKTLRPQFLGRWRKSEFVAAVARRVFLVPEAESDLDDAYWWYEDREPGLGEEFLQCIEEAFAKVARNPLHYPVRFDYSRRILVRRFPYAVYFECDDATVTIQYVFHFAQDPTRLEKRLGDR